MFWTILTEFHAVLNLKSIVLNKISLHVQNLNYSRIAYPLTKIPFNQNDRPKKKNYIFPIFTIKICFPDKSRKLM